ncbi:MAG: hypothetical protein IPP40_06475 [bacterium]|nr:hypothetical protein [bacterium]
MFSLKSKLILGFSALLAVAVIVGAIGSSVVNSYGQALTRILRGLRQYCLLRGNEERSK